MESGDKRRWSAVSAAERFATYLRSIIRSDVIAPWRIRHSRGLAGPCGLHAAEPQHCAFNLYAAAMFQHALARLRSCSERMVRAIARRGESWRESRWKSIGIRSGKFCGG